MILNEKELNQIWSGVIRQWKNSTTYVCCYSAIFSIFIFPYIIVLTVILSRLEIWETLPFSFSAHLQDNSVLLPLVSSAHEILTLLSHFWLPDSICTVTSLFLKTLFIFLAMLKDVTDPVLKFDLVSNTAPNIKKLHTFLQCFTTIIYQFIS